MAKILSNFQKEFLGEFGKSELAPFFIWSGGTALSYFYLKQRLSYDLDFLSQDLVPDDYLLAQINLIAQKLKVEKIEEQKKFNRHEFWLKKDEEVLRIEFVFYPFPRIKKTKKNKEFNVKIDSIEDILTNKAHAIFERSEPKDVFDFYWILKKKNAKFFRIFKWVKKKFGVEIDPVFFLTKILEGLEKLEKIKPLILDGKYFIPKKMKKYFETEAQKYLRRKVK